MTLIKSISGIRGTIGGKPGDNLTPLDIVKFTAAFGTWIRQNVNKEKCSIVVGRDARISGPMAEQIVKILSAARLPAQAVGTDRGM